MNIEDVITQTNWKEITNLKVELKYMIDISSMILYFGTDNRIVHVVVDDDLLKQIKKNIFDNLGICNNIQTLELINIIREDDLGTIYALIENNASIRVLNLNHNNICSYGTVFITKLLRSSESLEVLRMTGNYICLKSFGKLLNENKSLRVLDLSNTSFYNKDLLEFFHLLALSDSLEELSLINVNGHIDKHTINLIIGELENNYSLVEIFLKKPNSRVRNIIHRNKQMKLEKRFKKMKVPSN